MKLQFYTVTVTLVFLCDSENWVRKYNKIFISKENLVQNSV
jgi:hypothetical protein